jgi:hypothetical protein
MVIVTVHVPLVPLVYVPAAAPPVVADTEQPEVVNFVPPETVPAKVPRPPIPILATLVPAFCQSVRSPVGEAALLLITTGTLAACDPVKLFELCPVIVT